MTLLINKQENSTDLFFPLLVNEGGSLIITNDYDLSQLLLDLPLPTVANERYTSFNIDNNVFQQLNDGLYTYQLIDNDVVIYEGSIKIQLNDIGNNTDLFDVNEDEDDLIVVED